MKLPTGLIATERNLREEVGEGTRMSGKERIHEAYRNDT